MQLFLLISGFFFGFVTHSYADENSSNVAERKIPFFSDMTFHSGFLLSATDSSLGSSVKAVLNWGNEKNHPAWRLCQWGTRFDMANATCEHREGNSLYRNEAKEVIRDETDSDNRGLTLAIRGKAEYGDRPRRTGEAWPHLLVEQDATAIRSLSELKELRLKITLRLGSFQDYMGNDFDPGLHAAQFQLFLIIKNIHSQSENAGDFFWFGVPFFDSRHDIPPAYMARDVGKNDATGKFIYTLDGKTIHTIPMKRKQWIEVDCDLLPSILDGLKQAVDKSYLSDSDPHHYSPINMNMGWEMPGTYDASIQVKDFEMTYVPR